MKRIPFVLLLCIIAVFANAQNKSSLELSILSRYDQHADYTTRYFSRTYTDDTKLSGMSYCLAANYMHSFFRNVSFTLGLGYYRTGIDKIKQATRFNANASGRAINYPDSIQILFGTDAYYYHNVTASVGFTYEKPIRAKTYFITGADMVYLYTFSQSYYITYYHNFYNTHNARTLGWNVNAFAGVLQKLNNNKYYISPRLIIPVYQSLHGDAIFGEDETVRMCKWFHGFGLAVSFGKYF